MPEKDLNKSDIELSVIVPLLDEDESIGELAQKVHEALSGKHNYELIFVDDGSTDQSWQEIKKATKKMDHVLGIQLQRNYGKSSALQAGFENANGRYIATMDADLQDDPNEIP